MPKVKANNITMNYDQQGTGEPLILIPYLAADHACYAFQVAEYAKHLTCISLDLRGTGETDKLEGVYSTELLADDVAAFMQAAGIRKAHISGLSLGAAIGMWLAAKHPDKVRSLSLHSAWPKTDHFLRTVIEGFQVMAKGLDSVPEMVILGIFPWCFTPELYVIAHDVAAQLGRIAAPTQLTFGRTDQLTSTRFADQLKGSISSSELLIFEGCAHAPIYEKVEEFNQKTLQFLKRHTGAGTTTHAGGA